MVESRWLFYDPDLTCSLSCVLTRGGTAAERVIRLCISAPDDELFSPSGTAKREKEAEEKSISPHDLFLMFYRQGSVAYMCID